MSYAENDKTKKKIEVLTEEFFLKALSLRHDNISQIH